MLLTLGQLMTARGPAPEKLQRIAALVASIVEGGIAAIAVRNDYQANLCWLTAQDRAGERVELLASPQSPGRLIASSLAEGVPKVLNEIPAKAGPLLAGFAGHGRAAAAFPLLADDTPLGILLVMSAEPDAFTPRLTELLTAMAYPLGAFLKGMRLENELEAGRVREQKRLEVFQTAAASLSLNESTDEALRGFVDSARELVGANYGGVVVWDRDGQVRNLVALGLPAEDGQPHIGGLRAPELLGLLHYALVQEGKTAIRVADSAFGHTPESPDSPLLRSLLGVPFTSKSGWPAAFFLVDKQSLPRFTPDDERLLQLFTSMAAVLLDNIHLYEAVERQRRTLNRIQTSMSEGLVVLDSEGYITFSNPAAAELLGIDPARLEGVRLSDAIRAGVSCFATPESAEALAGFLDAPITGQSSFDISLLRPKPRDLAVSAFPIEVSAMERLAGLLLRDVTDERDLARRRDTFVSVASHELRTPMTTVLGFSELLLHRDTSPDQREIWLRHIYEDSQRVIHIVDDLLNVSRIQSGKMPVSIVETNIHRLAKAAADALQPSSEAHELIVTAGPDLPPAAADPDKVSQVLVNLISNAIKYSPAGGPVTISGRYDFERHRIVVSVSDHGIGIAEEDLGSLFTTFQRLSREETIGIGGTGLGLYIVKGLVELMRGEVWVESELHQGSTFSFSLPALR